MVILQFVENLRVGSKYDLFKTEMIVWRHFACSEDITWDWFAEPL